MRSLSLAGLVCGLALTAIAADSPPAPSSLKGTWSVLVLDNINQLDFCIIKVDEKDGKPQVELVAPFPPFKGAKLEKINGDMAAVHFDLNAAGRTFHINAYAPRDTTKAKNPHGNLQLNNQCLPLVLEPTDRKEIGQADMVKAAPGGTDLIKLQKEKDAKKQASGLADFVKKHVGTVLELPATQALLKAQIKEGDSADTLKETADRYLSLAATHGPELESHALTQVAVDLNRSKEPELALAYARKAAANIGSGDLDEHTLPVAKVLATALHKAGKNDEYEQLAGRIARAEEKLDREFMKTAVPFEVKPYAGRKDNSNRVVLVELFTGAQCPPCVSADIAFDAALKAYKPGDVALLQYHLHIPGPDPLTNADTEARQQYYGDIIRGTPTMLIDGKETEGLGGFKIHGKDRWGTLSKLLDKDLEKEPQAQVQLKVNRSGDELDLTANVEGLKKTGDKVRLRFVLLEEVARYTGRNGQRLHHHVVRSFPGGVEGFPLKEKSDKQSVKVSLSELKRSLTEYLDKADQNHPFLDEERPMDLKHLLIVAFVQDDESKEVFQAAQAEVPDGK